MIRFDPSALREAIASGVLLPQQAAPPLGIAERDFLRLVLVTAQGLGWRAAHFRPGMLRSGRWSTPVQGDGVGFPDLFLLRGGRMLFLELKSTTGYLRPEQQIWLEELQRVPGLPARVIRPGDWPELVRLLTET